MGDLPSAVGRPDGARSEVRAEQRWRETRAALPRPGCGLSRRLVRLEALGERLLGFLVEDVQVVGVEDCLDRLARLRLGRRIHARDELVAIG